MTQISATTESVAIDQVTIAPLAQPRDGRITIDVRLEGHVSVRWRRAFLLRVEQGSQSSSAGTSNRIRRAARGDSWPPRIRMNPS
jgi:hypothetical protein